ncbi:MAG: ATP-dependent Clp protease adaptor ClpS [Nitrospiraceae bacterium]|nr:ATP-dependent Clp protease adaptor ClpS [Nitrospiraceae bacterium]OQW66661.1 MAG: adaptor protein [Nitrospira sp. ST-bin5]
MAKPSFPLTTPDITEETGTGTGDGLESRVIVYNCDCHTYQQVISLLCKYVPDMTSSHAFELAYQIDHEGEAMVFEGEAQQAEQIASGLASGGLRVAVQ